LNLLQPVSKEIGKAFEQFKVISPSIVENAVKETPKSLERYVRVTLDEQQQSKGISRMVDQIGDLAKGESIISIV
jgi:predicted transport protein